MNFELSGQRSGHPLQAGDEAAHRIAARGPSSQRIRFGSSTAEHERIISPAVSVSPWTLSAAKRWLDVCAILAFTPLLLPLFLLVGLSVRLTSRGPVLVHQPRVGLRGRPFTIFKFRTHIDCGERRHPIALKTESPHLTRMGAWLLRLGLDELPMLFNVLAGDMSLVGPRPGDPHHKTAFPLCRPGLISAGNVAFAGAMRQLADIPRPELATLYFKTILPAKHQADVRYAADATPLSDLKLIGQALFRRGADAGVLDQLQAQYLKELSASNDADDEGRRQNPPIEGALR